MPREHQQQSGRDNLAEQRCSKAAFLQLLNIRNISSGVYFAYSRRWRRMSSAESKSNRSWQEIAAEASQEQDPKKLVELVEELERALNARDAEMRTASPARAAAP